MRVPAVPVRVPALLPNRPALLLGRELPPDGRLDVDEDGRLTEGRAAGALACGALTRGVGVPLPLRCANPTSVRLPSNRSVSTSWRIIP